MSADHARLKELRIDSIRVGRRHRRDMGDLTALADSKRQVGNRRGQRTDRQRVQKIAQVERGRKTREVAAERAGFGNHQTYRQVPRRRRAISNTCPCSPSERGLPSGASRPRTGTGGSLPALGVENDTKAARPAAGSES